ncbi:uncharacterized protein LOC135348196 isoform X3 [Halichondria panicea]|uniref:uncharacterized protein LOC135348196 isoform X3 n=1 Tax=Halichondria panicea TaxID=6063 RepID=UPI00312BB76F
MRNYLPKKMSRQPAPKTSHQVKPQPNKEQELYEHVEMQEQKSHYMTINRPNPVEVENKSQLAGQICTKVKRGKCVVIALIAVFMVIALVVSLVAVIIYSPLASGGDNTKVEDLLSRISQLEGRVQAIQGLNVTVANTVKSSALYSSQIASMQNLIQTSTLAQNNLRQDLDRLRTINLYEGCIQETGTCTITQSSSVTSYATCSTAYVTINPGDTQYFISSILCDFSYTSYFTSSTYYKSGNSIRCSCEVTAPSSSGHSSFYIYNPVCTLTVTKCPYTKNLLS